MKQLIFLSKLGANVTVNNQKALTRCSCKRFRIYGYFCCKWKSSINIT
ncbi:SWIM zinc finger family protein [Staphylococcus aureus]